MHILGINDLIQRSHYLMKLDEVPAAVKRFWLILTIIQYEQT